MSKQGPVLLSWSELTEEQKATVRAFELNELIGDITRGAFGFFGVQAIDAAIVAAEEDCERMRTPWLVGQAIHEKAGDLLAQWLQPYLENDMVYPSPGVDVRISKVVLSV